MNLRFLEIAVDEWSESVAFYNSQQPGLGSRFSNEVRDTIERIRAFPYAWPEIALRTRRCLVPHFPFGVYYQVRSDHILIISVFDQRRNPRIWSDWYSRNREQAD